MKLSEDNQRWSQRCQSHEEQLAAASKEIAAVQTSLSDKEKEAEVLRDCIQQLNAVSPADDAVDAAEDEEDRKRRGAHQ